MTSTPHGAGSIRARIFCPGAAKFLAVRMAMLIEEGMSGLLSSESPCAANMLGNFCGGPMAEGEELQLYTDSTLRDWIDAPPTAYSFSTYSTICARYRRRFILAAAAGWARRSAAA